MALFNFAKLGQDKVNDMAAAMAKGASGNLKSTALTLAVSAGESVAQQFLKQMGEGATKALTSRMSTQNSTLDKLTASLVDSLVSQIEKSASARLKAAGGGASQTLASNFGVPVRGVAPIVPPPAAAPLRPSFYDASGRVDPAKLYNAGGAGANASRLYQAPGQVFADLPEDGQRVSVPTQLTWSQRLRNMGGSAARGPMAAAASFYGVEHGLGSAVSAVGQSAGTSGDLAKATASLQKNIGDTSRDWKAFHDRITNIGDELGLAPQDAVAAAGTYMTAARKGSTGDVAQLMRFSTGYGLDPGAWSNQMSQAAGLGFVGGAKGSTSMGQYQSVLAQSYAGTSGVAKLGDYTTGYQDLARIMQANTVTTPNQSNVASNGALQLYTALNKTGVSGLSGTSGAALLGQLNQGIVNAPNASTGVQMAYYQALGGSKGISPSQLAYQTEEGLSGNNFKKVLDYSNKAYAGFSKSDKLYAQSKLFGLNMHQTDAVIKAYGSGNNGFSMQGLYGLVGGQKNLGNVNGSQLNLLTQLASGKSPAMVAAEMKQQGVSGADQLFKDVHGKSVFAGGSKQSLANVILHGGTPQSTDVSIGKAMTEAGRALTHFMDKIVKATAVVQTFSGAFGPIIPLLTGIALTKLPSFIRNFLPKETAPPVEGAAADVASGAAGSAATGGAAGIAARLAGKFAFVGRLAGAGATAVSVGAAANWGMNAAENAVMGKDTFKGFHKVNDPWNNVPVLGGVFGGTSLARNGSGWNLLDFLEPHMSDQSPLMPNRKRHVGTIGGAGHIPGLKPTGPAGGGGFGTILGKHVQSMGNIYTDHLKAANKVTEDETKRSLSTVTPLPTNTLRQFNSDLSTFVKNFGDKLDGWLQAALNQATSSSTLPGGSSGAFGSAGSAITSLGGANPFSKYGIAAKYGKDQGGLFGSYHDVEKGNVYSMPVGSAVDLPTAAKYMAHDSTKYQSVFQLPNGQAMNFMHINATHFKDGQMVKAGQSIGTVGGMSGAYSAKTWDGKMSHSYFQSNPGLMEFGVFDNATDAFMRDSQTGNPYNMNGSVDPNAFLASLGQGGPSGGGVPPGLSPQLKKLYMAAGAKYHVPWQFLAKQGFKESSWNPTITSRDGGIGIAQFTGRTGAQYLGGQGWQQRALNPALSIDAQGHYMQDLMSREGGNLWAAARDYNGSGSNAIAYANSLVGPQGGGGAGSVVSPSGGTFEATLHLIYPNGATQDVQATFRPKYAGVVGTHIAKTAPHKKAPVR